MSNDTLTNFHPLPKGLARDRRYRRLSLVASRLLVDAHMTADEAESDGLIDAAEFESLAVLARIPLDAVGPAVDELRHAGFVIAVEPEEYVLADFRGLAHEVRERRRLAGRDKKRRQRALPSGYQMSPGDTPRPSPGVSRPPEGEGETEGEREALEAYSPHTPSRTR